MNTNDFTIKLKDGRVFGYAEYGDRNGKPLFFFHGWPSSRLQGQRFDGIAKKLKVRMIAIDRPGYGLSDFKLNRTLVDFPDDILELADYLKIQKFAVLGVSGGGPYAAVCAYKIPSNITNAGIVVGLCPTDIEGVFEGMGSLNKFGWLNYRRFPLLRFLSSFLGWFETKYLPTNLYSLLISKPDRALATKSFEALTRRSRQEAFKQGIKGAAQDLKLYTDNWGFALNKIKIPTFLWYGDVDKTVSFKMGEYYALQIPNSKLKIFPQEGHYLYITHAEEILQTLTFDTGEGERI